MASERSVVLDTHAWVWWLSTPAKLGKKAARAIAAAARDRFNLSPSRLATAAGEPAGSFAVVEVFALP